MAARAQAESLLVRGAVTNVEFGQLSPRTRGANPRCVQCNTEFQGADKVHRLACGHVGHRNPCLNPLFRSGNLVVRADAELHLEEVEGGVDQYRLAVGPVDVQLERRCPQNLCGQPIELDRANVDRAAQIHRRLREAPQEQIPELIVNAALDPQGMENVQLVQEYIRTFSVQEEAILELEENDRKRKECNDKCSRVFTLALPLFLAAVASCVAVQSLFYRT